MSLWTIVAQVFGLLPQGIDAGKQIAEAIKPNVRINPQDATLWHTLSTRIDSTVKPPRFYRYCEVCQRAIPAGLANQLCSEAVRARNALYS